MPPRSPCYSVARLVRGDVSRAKALFATMAAVFDEGHADLGTRSSGGLTAHTLPMTRSESREIFIYDVAVRADHQRRGVGRLLLRHLARLANDAGIVDLFVPADDEDVHALEFYRALGGAASRVTFFSFGPALASSAPPPGAAPAP